MGRDRKSPSPVVLVLFPDLGAAPDTLAGGIQSEGNGSLGVGVDWLPGRAGLGSGGKFDALLRGVVHEVLPPMRESLVPSPGAIGCRLGEFWILRAFRLREHIPFMFREAEFDLFLEGGMPRFLGGVFFWVASSWFSAAWLSDFAKVISLSVIPWEGWGDRRRGFVAAVMDALMMMWAVSSIIRCSSP